MPILIPMPDGFTPPNAKQFPLPALFAVADENNLALLTLAGQPVEDAAEEAAEGPEEEQSEAPNTAPPSGGGSPTSFQQAVEQGMGR